MDSGVKELHKKPHPQQVDPMKKRRALPNQLTKTRRVSSKCLLLVSRMPTAGHFQDTIFFSVLFETLLRHSPGH